MVKQYIRLWKTTGVSTGTGPVSGVTGLDIVEPPKKLVTSRFLRYNNKKNRSGQTTWVEWNFKKNIKYVRDPQICCHFTTHNIETTLKINDETKDISDLFSGFVRTVRLRPKKQTWSKKISQSFLSGSTHLGHKCRVRSRNFRTVLVM